jgi:hypothetical protein
VQFHRAGLRVVFSLLTLALLAQPCWEAEAAWYDAKRPGIDRVDPPRLDRGPRVDLRPPRLPLSKVEKPPNDSAPADVVPLQGLSERPEPTNGGPPIWGNPERWEDLGTRYRAQVAQDSPAKLFPDDAIEEQKTKKSLFIWNAHTAFVINLSNISFRWRRIEISPGKINLEPAIRPLIDYCISCM